MFMRKLFSQILGLLKPVLSKTIYLFLPISLHIIIVIIIY